MNKLKPIETIIGNKKFSGFEVSTSKNPTTRRVQLYLPRNLAAKFCIDNSKVEILEDEENSCLIIRKANPKCKKNNGI